MSDYQISEEDIDGVMHYMKIFHPEKADRAYCRALLEYFKSGLHKIARSNPDDIEAIYESYETHLKDIT